MYRKGVSALITNKEKRFLLVNLESFETCYFAIPGGGIDNNETPEDAVYREIEEELGITKNSLSLIGKSEHPVRFNFKSKKLSRDNIDYEGSERQFFGFMFTGTNEEISLPDGEVRSYKWVSLDEMSDFLLFDNQLEETVSKINEIFG